MSFSGRRDDEGSAVLVADIRSTLRSSYLNTHVSTNTTSTARVHCRRGSGGLLEKIKSRLSRFPLIVARAKSKNKKIKKIKIFSSCLQFHPPLVHAAFEQK